MMTFQARKNDQGKSQTLWHRPERFYSSKKPNSSAFGQWFPPGRIENFLVARIQHSPKPVQNTPGKIQQ
jgi:hypothetical protein